MAGNREVEEQGFAFRRGALLLTQLARVLSVVLHAKPGTADSPAPHALRNVLWDRRSLAATLGEVGADDIATEVLGAAAFAINALYFDKTSGANWKVPCHQDLMMPVQAECHEPGFAGWTVKAGVTHVEPPAEVLANLIALRIHFDDCSAANGSLAVLPGSHQRGKLRDADLMALDRDAFVDCEAMRGDVLVMKPLLVRC